MKIKFMSDLHLEFEPPNVERFPIPYSGEHYLVLAGDIQVGIKKKKWFTRLLKERSVIYVPGNHEYYDQDWVVHRQRLRMFAGWVNDSAARKNYCGRLIVLDNNTFEAGIVSGYGAHEVVFIGSTLWSKIDPTYAILIQRDLNDYHCIRTPNGKLSPTITSDEHAANVQFLREQIKQHAGKKIVVITHHAPSFASVQPQWVGSPYNSAYASNCEHLMDGVSLWIHGHMHDSFEYKIGDCTVACNPKGYRNQNKGFDIHKIIEV